MVRVESKGRKRRSRWVSGARGWKAVVAQVRVEAEGGRRQSHHAGNGPFAGG